MPDTILIVDDHTAVRRTLIMWLKTLFSECQVIAAANGEDAVAIAADTSPCLVIMDIHLPKMDGIEATRRIKAAVPGAQVVMLTMHGDEIRRKEAQAAGAVAYVLKANMGRDLVRILTPLLPEGRAGSSAAVC
jgi:DNA-binding NarL/FixJ family response regulator